MGNVIYTRRIVTVGDKDVIIEMKNVKTLNLHYSRRYRMFSVSAPVGTNGRDILGFIMDHSEWMDKVRRKEDSRPMADALNVEDLQEWAKYVGERVPYWESRMGLKASRVKLKLMVSRWGSCNPEKKSISLSSNLAHYPKECTDYVIVHELAHFVHPNHSDKFWELVRRYCPENSQIRRVLRASKNGENSITPPIIQCKSIIYRYK
jgi:hypothetical protein